MRHRRGPCFSHDMPQRNDRHLQAVVIACMLIGGCAGDPRSAAKEFARSGDAYLSAGKLPEAVVEYRNAIQNDPQDGTIRLKLGEAYLRLGDPRKALEECVRAADLLPEDSNARLKAGDLFLLVGRFDDAKLSAEKVLAREPKNVPAQILLATSLAGLKDLDAAIAQIEEAIHLDPQRGTTYGNLGAFELERGRRMPRRRRSRRRSNSIRIRHVHGSRSRISIGRKTARTMLSRNSGRLPKSSLRIPWHTAPWPAFIWRRNNRTPQSHT